MADQVMADQAVYLALACALIGASLGVGLNGGGVFLLHSRKGRGALGLGYRAYLVLVAASVALAAFALITAYLVLDWQAVVLIHVVSTLTGAAAGGLLWFWWTGLSARPLLAEVGLFHAMGAAGGIGFMVLVTG